MIDRDLEIRLLTACAIVREAGRLAHDYFTRREQLDVEHKGVQDLVSVADREVEDLIRTRLGTAFPEDGLLGEEGGGEDGAGRTPEEDGAPDAGGGRSSRAMWVIDPIDGTANFLRGMPYWSVALAYVLEDRVEIGATYDPVHDELFSARRGGGALRLAVAGRRARTAARARDEPRMIEDPDVDVLDSSAAAPRSARMPRSSAASRSAPTR